jgi:hypothetical protein
MSSRHTTVDAWRPCFFKVHALTASACGILTMIGVVTLRGCGTVFQPWAPKASHAATTQCVCSRTGRLKLFLTDTCLSFSQPVAVSLQRWQHALYCKHRKPPGKSCAERLSSEHQTSMHRHTGTATATSCRHLSAHDAVYCLHSRNLQYIWRFSSTNRVCRFAMFREHTS